MKKVIRFLNTNSDKLADVLFGATFVALFLWLLSTWLVYRSDPTTLSSYAAFGTGAGTAALALVTFFMARSTSRMVKESRLERQQLYVTEFIALVVDPLIEIVEKHKKTVSRRSFDFGKQNRNLAEEYTEASELSRFEVPIADGTAYFLPSVNLEIMKGLQYHGYSEFGRGKEIKEYNEALMKKIAEYDEQALQLPKKLGTILVSIHSCLTQSARFDAVENNTRPYLVATVFQKIALSDSEFKEFLNKFPWCYESPKALEIYMEADLSKRLLPETCELQLRKLLDNECSKMMGELTEIAAQLERLRADMCRQFSVSETAIRDVRRHRWE